MYFNCSQRQLIDLLRKLWEQHIMWTRSFIISTAEGLGDLPMVTERLLRNPSDFAKVFKQFYGPEIAEQLEKLFREHLLIAADLVTALKVGDTAKAAESNKKWYANADEIAAFLSSINPYWDDRQWRNLLYDHLDMTAKEATERLNKQYEEDVKRYDTIEHNALQMADFMASGILAQFRI
ncbi:acetylglutamate kinase [Hydrogenoanaerobacterium sp.]|uniref:acetylglutamate kinase n=1 Tax=Hydrogenoanaerobacterium sp. TaxID=2953763 RepID=UPI00289ACD6C|nr:acetylglutamate kinase [Hydrogenoanaerobacterium sp.]